MPLIYHAVRDNAKAPAKAHPSDAGWDVFACQDLVLKPGMTASIPTGLVVKFQPTAQQQASADAAGFSWYLRAADKSGLALKNGIHILAGVVDSGYRGELVIVAANLGFFRNGMPTHVAWTVKAGDKVAQIVPELIWTCETAMQGEMEATDRGGNGFGSSGPT
jgi:dUTP pyrophosphatase